MAKKYLLYIHDMRFDVEPEKSKLVNELLDKHYGVAGVPVLLNSGRPVKLDSAEGQRLEKVIAFCKHNQVLGFCKKGCK